MKKYIVILIVACCIISAYILYSFYEIEHIETEQGTYLITKQSELYNILNSNRNTFDKIVNDICCQEIGNQDYYLIDYSYGDDFEEIKRCNISWIRVNYDRNVIQFFQTLGHGENHNGINLFLECHVDDTGTLSWEVNKSHSPDQTQRGSIIVRLYDLIYN